MSTLSRPINGYVYMLDSDKICYVPTCLLLRMITNCFSGLSLVNMTGSVASMVSDVQNLVGRLTDNLMASARAYEQNRVMFFPGDWKNERVRVKNLLSSVVSRIGFMGELVGQRERGQLAVIVEGLSRSWSMLTRILDGRNTREMNTQNNLPTVSYFHSENPDTWKHAMALTLLDLDEKTGKMLPGRRLILLCHRRVRMAILKGIEEIERKNHVQKPFSPDKILCLYNDDVPVTCPNCAKMTEMAHSSTRRAIRKSYLRESQIRAKNAGRPDTVVMDGGLAIPESLLDTV